MTDSALNSWRSAAVGILPGPKENKVSKASDDLMTQHSKLDAIVSSDNHSIEYGLRRFSSYNIYFQQKNSPRKSYG
jgi:hypothetical protein